MKRYLALATALTLASAPVFAAPWQIGQEREVDEGYYLTLLKSEHGWRLWQVETKDGTRCQAIKSAKGRPHPVPLGVAEHFTGGTPYLIVSKGNKGFAQFGRLHRFELKGRHGSGEGVQFRKPNDRFWTKWAYDLNLDDRDGQLIEVSITSWQYPHSRVGMASETGIIDLTGLAEMVKEVEGCGTLDY